MSWFVASRDWFLARSLRERWLLSIMLAILLPLLTFLLIYRPLMERLEVAKVRHVEAVRRHAAVEAQVAQLRLAPSDSAASSTGPLNLRVTDAAARAGVRLTGNTPQESGTVAIVVAPGLPGPTLRWLRQLEGSGLRIRELAITPQGSGAVVVSATLVDGAIQ